MAGRAFRLIADVQGTVRILLIMASGAGKHFVNLVRKRRTVFGSNRCGRRGLRFDGRLRRRCALMPDDRAHMYGAERSSIANANRYPVMHAASDAHGTQRNTIPDGTQQRRRHRLVAAAAVFHFRFLIRPRGGRFSVKDALVTIDAFASNRLPLVRLVARSTADRLMSLQACMELALRGEIAVAAIGRTRLVGLLGRGLLVRIVAGAATRTSLPSAPSPARRRGR